MMPLPLPLLLFLVVVPVVVPCCCCCCFSSSSRRELLGSTFHMESVIASSLAHTCSNAASSFAKYSWPTAPQAKASAFGRTAAEAQGKAVPSSLPRSIATKGSSLWSRNARVRRQAFARTSPKPCRVLLPPRGRRVQHVDRIDLFVLKPRAHVRLFSR